MPHGRAVSFLDGQYAVTGTGLAALLRYAGGDPEATGQQQMAATHRVLQECLDSQDWPRFQEAAVYGKASASDVAGVIYQLVEIHTARPWRAGMRLLGYAAGHLAELDGTLLAETGRGLADLTPRQLCNLVFARLIAGKDEEQRAEFIEDLYLDFDPEAEAREKVLQMIASREAANGSS